MYGFPVGERFAKKYGNKTEQRNIFPKYLYYSFAIGLIIVVAIVLFMIFRKKKDGFSDELTIHDDYCKLFSSVMCCRYTGDTKSCEKVVPPRIKNCELYPEGYEVAIMKLYGKRTIDSKEDLCKFIRAYKCYGEPNRQYYLSNEFDMPYCVKHTSDNAVQCIQKSVSAN